MMKLRNNYTVQYISRWGLFLAGVLGVALQLILNGGANMLLYYTILSNILVTVFMGYLVYLMAKKDPRYQSNSFLRIKTGVIMAILITFVIYHTMLRPYIFPAQFYRLENLLFHYIAPSGSFWMGWSLMEKSPFQNWIPLSRPVLP